MYRHVELTELQQYLYERYTMAEAVGASDLKDGIAPHQVVLQVTNQRFIIGDIPAEDALHADWLRRMLAKALSNIVLAK